MIKPIFTVILLVGGFFLLFLAIRAKASPWNVRLKATVIGIIIIVACIIVLVRMYSGYYSGRYIDFSK